ncbi:uncharacterized protein LOC142570328 [Dermacentor variabilis]|uniref:uncharacterized protein LOC142570328 n=1 Tax=Dermacentor variabilis TaxID=34621 RepID=UPI003F5B44C9
MTTAREELEYLDAPEAVVDSTRGTKALLLVCILMEDNIGASESVAQGLCEGPWASIWSGATLLLGDCEGGVGCVAEQSICPCVEVVYGALRTLSSYVPESVPVGVDMDMDRDMDMERDIMASEVRAVLNRIKTTAAVGDDRITNKMLRNLDDQSVAALADIFNHHWHEGRLPDSWKHANDIMWQIQDDMLDPGPIRTTRTIIGLDVSKAFDIVSHASILTNLSQMDVGTHTYNCIANFLNDRTAELHIGDLCSDKVTMGTRETLQGALSPFLFNITIRGLPTLLDTIPHIKHSIYANDITLWTNSGSDGEIQDSRQQAIDTVHTCVQANSLVYLPTKSELLVIRDRRVHRPVPDLQEPITLNIAAHPIPPVQTMRVLGVLVENNTQNSEAIQRLRTTAHQINGLIRRIATCRGAVRETDLCRFTQAYLISRIVYTCPYYHLRRNDKEAVNSIIHSAYKAAMGLPQSASTQRLLQLGV